MSSENDKNKTHPSIDWTRMMGAAYDDLLRRPNDETRSSSLLPAPSRETMEERWAFRESITERTKQQRRIHVHDGMGETGCNVLYSLWDRERRGARAIVLKHRTRSQQPQQQQQQQHGDKLPQENGTLPSEQATTVSPKPKMARGENYPMRIFREIRTYAEYCSVVRYQTSYFHHLGGNNNNDTQNDNSANAQDSQQQQRPTSTSSPAVSTISMAFSPDAQTLASTHGDHTVKITCCATGRLVETLEGHPRTPWTVKYHPTNPHIVASGCLGFQVRVWNWPDRNCLHMIRLNHAIISLSFHPTGKVLAVASGSRLHFWDYNNEGGLMRTTSGGEEGQTTTTTARSSQGVLTEVEQRHMLRCVHFPPSGDTIIVGGMNPSSNEDHPRQGRGGMSGGGMSFYLRLWDFSLYAALHPYANNGTTNNGDDHNNSDTNNNSAITSHRTGNRLAVQRKVLTNPRTFVPRALLYNDGGFDVSPDGKTLCACAEYWLPDGVDSAMELLEKEEECDMAGSDDEEEEKDANKTGPTESAGETSSDMAVTSPPAPSVQEEQPSDGFTSPTRDVSTPVPNEASFASPPRQQNGRNNPIAATPTLPITPPNPNRNQRLLSPPSPPGRRWIGGLGQRRAPTGSTTLHTFGSTSNSFRTNPGSIPPPPPAPRDRLQLPNIKPHPLSVVSGGPNYPDVTSKKGRYVPHVVTVSLDTAPITTSIDGGPVQGRGQMSSVARGHRPRLGQLLEASPLEGARASGVTCVKFSPSADFCLLGYGVREPQTDGGNDAQYHPVTALYRVRGGMTHVSTMLSSDDDVNIARFHPNSGYGFVYGTKQGRVRVLSPRPWNYYSC